MTPMNAKQRELIERLAKVQENYKWANHEVSETAKDAISMIEFMQQRTLDLERLIINRELYRGEG